MKTLQQYVEELSQYLSQMEKDRYSTPLANDVFEAAWYWRDLGQWVLEKNTKVDFPSRAKEEQVLLDRLKGMVNAKSLDEQPLYQSVFEAANEILRAVAATLPPADGHLGILRILHANFGWLENDYAFKVVEQQPLGMKYSSGSVWVELKYAERTSQCCTFGPDGSREVFWPEDLLFVYGDQRYYEVQQERPLRDAKEVEAWFQTVSGIFRQYGRDVLTNQPGIFSRLADAQARRDAELTAEMNERYGEGPASIRSRP